MHLQLIYTWPLMWARSSQMPSLGLHKHFELTGLPPMKRRRWLLEHINVPLRYHPHHRRPIKLISDWGSRRPSGKGLIAIAIRPQKPLLRLMSPLTIMEPSGAYLWIIKPLIKAHVGNNVDIYCGTIEIRGRAQINLWYQRRGVSLWGKKRKKKS